LVQGPVVQSSISAKLGLTLKKTYTVNPGLALIQLWTTGPRATICQSFVKHEVEVEGDSINDKIGSDFVISIFNQISWYLKELIKMRMCTSFTTSTMHGQFITSKQQNTGVNFGLF